MIGLKQELCRIAETRIGGEPRSVGMTVWAHDRQLLNLAKKLPRDRSDALIRWKQAVGMKVQRLGQDGYLSLALLPALAQW
jgi:hypothetical protein